MDCLFVSDLHGKDSRYRALFALIEHEKPEAVFLGGDVFPSGLAHQAKGGSGNGGFLEEVLAGGCRDLRSKLRGNFPRIFLILGNDDGLFEENEVLRCQEEGLWHYMHGRSMAFDGFRVYGYSCIPPSPFRLKHFERYDVSRFVDPGSVAPEDGWHGTELSMQELRARTIQQELAQLTGSDDMTTAILLFHAPPYRSNLDRAALDEVKVESAPLDVNIGSIAIRQLIEQRQPLLTLHGHVHESARLTGRWRDRIGRTHLFTAAHDGPELAVVRFDPERLEEAERELIA